MQRPAASSENHTVATIGDGVEVRPSSIAGVHLNLMVHRSKYFHSCTPRTPICITAVSCDCLPASLLVQWCTPALLTCPPTAALLTFNTGAGLGLWSSRPFKRNDLITSYSGDEISYVEALRLRNAGKGSHIRTIESRHTAINGIKLPQPGEGGASFANDARSRQINNAKLINK